MLWDFLLTKKRDVTLNVFYTDIKKHPSFTICHGGYVFGRIHSLACSLVCKQDYKKTTEQISMTLGWRMGLGPE